MYSNMRDCYMRDFYMRDFICEIMSHMRDFYLYARIPILYATFFFYMRQFSLNANFKIGETVMRAPACLGLLAFFLNSRTLSHEFVTFLSRDGRRT